MYNYINKFISDSKIYMYNLLYSDYHHCRKKYQNLSEDITYNVPIHMNEEELKQKIELELEKNLQKDRLLVQQNKLASMGEMLGNIAHQWRQPLNN